jgi:hypothetical protein
MKMLEDERAFLGFPLVGILTWIISSLGGCGVLCQCCGIPYCCTAWYDCLSSSFATYLTATQNLK